MPLTPAIARAMILMSLALGPPRAAVAQPPPTGAVGGPFTGPVVTNAPFTAEATAELTGAPGGATTRELTVESRYFRDSTGRVRLEQTIPGAGTATGPAVYAVVQTKATSSLVHVLDPATKTFRYHGRSMYSTGFGGFGLTVAVTPVRYRTYQSHEWRHGELGLPGYEHVSGITETPLGTKQMEGLTVVGRRFTATVLSGTKQNGGTVEIVDEVWESPDLRVVIASRTTDPRSGVLDYRVTKIRRTEPSAQLFEVPAGFLDRPKSTAEPYEFLYEPARPRDPARSPGAR